MFKNLRLLVFLRRIALALESLARSQSELSEHARNLRLARAARAARRPRATEFGVLDIKESEKRWRAERGEDNVDLDGEDSENAS